MPSLLSASDRELLSREVSGATRERMLREMGEALEVLTAELPLVLVLEDLHWSDHSTVDLLSYLAQQREPAHLMIIGTYRDAELIVSGHPLKAVKQELLAKQQCQELPLEYLSEAAVTSYLKERFAENRFPGGLSRMIRERTEGNALFMVNAVDYLVTAQQIVEGADGWDLSVDLANVELGVPDNIKQMIEKQFDRLSAGQQQLLEAASVAGAEFSHLAVVAGLEDDRQRVETLFEELARKRHYIQDCGIHELPNGQVATRYGFVHALYRSVLYERLSPARRIQMHRSIGERGEEVYGERAKEIAGELAMHFEHGRDHKRAAKYFQQAADNAIRRFAYREAVVLARRGIEMLEKLPPGPERVTQELYLQLALGVPLIATEGYASPDVGKAYSRARQLAQQIGDTPDIAEVLWGLWTFHMLRAELETSREIAEEFLRLAARLPYPGLALHGHWALEITFTHLGEFELALDHFQQALALYEPEQHREDSFLYALNPGVAMPCFAAWALWIIGETEESLQRIEEALSLAHELSEPHGLAHAFFFASFLHHLRRDAAKTLEFADAVIAVSVEHGLLMYHAMATVMRGWALGEQQQEDEAIATMYGGLAALRVTGTHLVQSYFLALLAEALARAGQIADALGLIDEAIETLNQNGERYCEAELYRVKGEVLLRQDPPALAAAKLCFEQSLKIARQQKAIAWEQRTMVSLAKLGRSKAHGK
jgi:predicted ATPase